MVLVDPVQQQAREQRVLELRAQRVSFAAIAEELGVSRQRVGQIFEKARDRIPAQRLADIRNESAELIDRAIANLLEIAENDSINPNTGSPFVSPHARVEAWQAIRGFDESLRRLFGADSPVRREVTIITDDMIDSAIKQLTAEIAELDAKMEADADVASDR